MTAGSDPSGRPKLLFLVTEDWYFCSHRLPVARAARDAGFDVIVACRVRAHGERIRAEGFALRPLQWRRSGDGIAGHWRAIREIAGLYRAERPAIVHHVALKPVLFGGLAARLAFRGGAARPAQVSAIMGLGRGLPGIGGFVLPRALRLATARGRVIVQNAEDRAALVGYGVDAGTIVLIRGSGVDAARFAPLPHPSGSTVILALVGRMLRNKGVLDAVEALRTLRRQGLAVELLLAGAPDSDNPDSLSEDALQALGAEPGIVWLGRVEDVRSVWARAAIGVFPSTYGEGVPMALLEAAACGRPVVASDIAGCREAVRPGETGLLTPPNDVSRLADAIASLAGDAARRRAMGRAGRTLMEREFAQPIIVDQTLALYRALLRASGWGMKRG